LPSTPSHRHLHSFPTRRSSDLIEFQRLVRKMPVADEVMRYAVQLARTSRPSGANPPDFVKQYLNYGASLRASQFLILGAKALARSEEHTSELQSRSDLVCRLLL